MRIGARLARVVLHDVLELGLELVSLLPLVLVLRWLRCPRRRSLVAAPRFRRIDVEPDLHQGQYPLIAARCQSIADQEPAPSGALLDLRARPVQAKLFEYLAATWRATPGDVPRLGVLLDYEPWALLRIDVERLLRPLDAQGVQVHVFYAQQEQDAVSWFEDGVVRHSELRGLIAWIRREWQRQAPADWSRVLDATAVLMQSVAEYEAVPDLIIELVDIALSFEGATAAEQGHRHARAALHWTGTVPSAARCRALRSLAMTQLRLPDPRVAVLYLDAAFRDAIIIGDRAEQIRALAELAGCALRGNNLARAENHFRTACDLSTPDVPADLRARVHRGLADARNQQGLNDEETEHHAATALQLDDEDSDLAGHDDALLKRVQASRDDQSATAAAEVAERNK